MNQVEEIYGRRWTEQEIRAMRRVWSVLTRSFLQRFIPEDADVLDLGAGLCHFSNEIKARRRVAMDANPAVRSYADPGVEVVVSDDLQLSEFADGEFTHVFMSNFLEHLPNSDAVVEVLCAARRKLAADGSVLILGRISGVRGRPTSTSLTTGSC